MERICDNSSSKDSSILQQCAASGFSTESFTMEKDAIFYIFLWYSLLELFYLSFLETTFLFVHSILWSSVGKENQLG